MRRSETSGPPTLGLATLALWATLSASCGPTPIEVTQAALEAVQDADPVALGRRVASAYADPLGGRTELLADVEAWANEHPVRAISGRAFEAERGRSRARARVSFELSLELSGLGASVRASGPTAVELERDGDFRIRSGLLTEVRDALELMSARRRALEANDVDAYVELLHPGYRDGAFGPERLVEQLREDLPGRIVRLEPLGYLIELREDLVHVDERHRLSIDGALGPVSTARLTLAKSAGRLRIRSGLRQAAP